jgi:hypothetical protein
MCPDCRIFGVLFAKLRLAMTETPDDLPPFARSWPHLYAIVLGSLVVEIGLFYVLMHWLS